MVPNKLSPKLQYFRHTKEQKFFCPKRVTTKCARHSQMWEEFISVNIIFFKEGWISVVSFRLFCDKETAEIGACISVSGRAGKLPNYHMYTTDFFRTTKIYIWKTELNLAAFSLNVCSMKENKLLPQKDYWYLGLIL